MAVPNIFANVTTSIPLSQLDQNFATAVVLGNTSVYLGNTTTTLGNVTLANANVTTALTIAGASGTSGQVLTSGGANTAPTWSTVSPSAATPTALGTVYGKTDSSALAFIGYNAGVNTTGTGNTALGYVALQTNTSGTYNTAVGWNAGQAATGSENTFVGVQAGSASTGSYNVAIGKQALQLTTSGNSNVGVGLQALASLTTKTHNVAIGYQALYNTNEDANTAVGSFSLKTNTTGYYNKAMGYESLTALTTGIGNVAVGFQTGSVLTTGSYNIYVGYGTGNATKTSGVDCIYIGRTISPSSSGVNGEMVINTNGNNVTGKGDGTGFIHTGGNLFQGNNNSTWATTSDQRLKKNIVDNTQGLEKISQIQVRNFEYRLPEEVTELDSKNAIDISGVQLGVIAQELQAVLPDCVKEESSGVLTVDSDNLTWYLINAVKELKAELDALKAKVA